MGVSHLCFKNRVCVCVCVRVHMYTQTQDVLLRERGQASLVPLCIELLKCGHHGFLVVVLL